MATEGRHEAVRLKTLLVQINIPQEAAQQLWNALDVHMAYEDETLKALEELAEKDAKRLEKAMEQADDGGISLSWPDWVMWPETALTGRIFRTDEDVWGTSIENQEHDRAGARRPGRFN